MKFFIFATSTTVLVFFSFITVISEIEHVHVVGGPTYPASVFRKSGLNLHMLATLNDSLCMDLFVDQRMILNVTP